MVCMNVCVSRHLNEEMARAVDKWLQVKFKEQ